MPRKKDFGKIHRRNLDRIGLLIDRIFSSAAERTAQIGSRIRIKGEDKAFRWEDYPNARQAMDDLIEELASTIEMTVVNGVDEAWDLSNEKNDGVVRETLGKRLEGLPEHVRNIYMSRNNEARKSFLSRVEKGLDLSDRVWKYSEGFKNEMELALDVGITEGKSAPKLARELKQYLQHPDKLFRRVRDERGMLHLSKNAEDYHPGTGVYRSSYKNARRLAVTETNIAYLTSDHLRWQQMDFVVGIEVKLSGNHTCLGSDGKPHELTDICDELKGFYPKDFKFTGWHPQCRCYAVSILKTDDEIEADAKRIAEGDDPLPPDESENYIAGIPEDFKDWIADNKERIEGAKSQPYFIRDNEGYVEKAMNPKSQDDKPQEKAKKEKTEIQFTKEEKEFIEKWPERESDLKRVIHNPEYEDVEFNVENGGLKAIHLGHEKQEAGKEKKFFGKKYSSIDLEKICQNILFANGFSCILENEHVFDPITHKQITSLDSTTNGMRMDIKSITEKNGQTILNGIKAKRKQLHSFNKVSTQKSDSLILYFHDESFFDEKQVIDGIQRSLKRIICVFGNGTIKIYT